MNNPNFVDPAPLFADGQALPPVLHGAVGRSRALHSNWLWVRSLGLMVDAGEGSSIDLGRLVGAPDRVLITHGHSDHVLGLPSLIAARQFPSLVSGGPLEIVHPAGCPGIASVRGTMLHLWGDASFDRIVFRAMEDGDRIPLGENRELVAFRTEHSRYMPSLGYAVVERRRRLQDQYRTLDQATVRSLVLDRGREALEEEYERTVFAHTGDCRRTDSPLFEEADLVVFDGTFLSAADRDDDTHASVEEVLEVASSRRVRHVVLHHLSLRYPRDEAIRSIRGMSERCPGIQVILFDGRELLPISGER